MRGSDAFAGSRNYEVARIERADASEIRGVPGFRFAQSGLHGSASAAMTTAKPSTLRDQRYARTLIADL
jgi:hypothetical protein